MTFLYKADVGTYSYREIEHWVTTSGPGGVWIGSDFRPNSITVNGSVSYHARGNAVDWLGSAQSMINLAAWLEGFFPYILELEHSAGARPGKPDGYWVKDGAIVGPDRYGAQNVKDHYSHVHLAMTLSGLAAAQAQGSGILIANQTGNEQTGMPCAFAMAGMVGTGALAATMIGELAWRIFS